MEISQEKEVGVFFDIVLSFNYPISPPLIFCKSKFCSPSLADGRDLLNSVILDWSPKVTISDIIKKLVNFLSKIHLNDLTTIGNYDLNRKYNIEEFLVLDVGVFPYSNKKINKYVIFSNLDYCNRFKYLGFRARR